MAKKPTYEELEQRVKELEKEQVERKRTAEELLIRARVLDSMVEGVNVSDENSVIFFTNPAFDAMFGYEHGELIGKNVSILNTFTPEENVRFVGEVIEKLKTQGAWHGEINNLKKDGTSFITSSHVSALHISGKSYFISVQEDVTLHKEAEEARKVSEARLETILESAQDGIFELDFNTAERKYANQAMADMLGFTKEELLSMSFMDNADPETVEMFRKIRREMIRTKRSVREIEYEMIRNDGSRITLSTTFTPLINSEGRITDVVGIMRDVTERKQVEEDLRQSEERLARSKKMESMGLLAGGVAHDLNNVLSGIVSYPELLLLNLPEDSDLRKPIETIQESGHRAVAIVQDLLTVARGVATIKEPLNLNDLVNGYLNSPEFKKLEQFNPTVTVKTDLDTDLLNVSGSQVHIRKVLMNLVSNASEAIEGSGNVTISTMNRYVDRPLRGYDDVNIGEYAVLSVSDDGSGISSGDIERIFEPFYTRKVMGRSGTGLGLAVVWNVVKDHKGYIDVTTGENGTTFELYFKITRDEISDKDLSIPIKDYKGNGETILVVDDVESQRDISCKMLDTLGYMAKAVSSGEEAVEYLKAHTVDLILLDMIMDPGINGRETYERVIKIHPKQKAIIISGFTETGEVKEAQKLGAGKYIRKPVTLEKIGLTVKEELEK